MEKIANADLIINYKVGSKILKNEIYNERDGHKPSWRKGGNEVWGIVFRLTCSRAIITLDVKDKIKTKRLWKM